MRTGRITRAAARAQFWVGEIARADTGDKALTDALRWLRKELSLVSEHRPEDADAARWDIARQIAAYTAQVPRARIDHRTGLAPSEVWQLLHPWGGPPEGGSQ